MTQSLALAQANLQAVLMADSGLTAWAQTHFNKDWNELKANRPVKVIRPDEYPLRVYELDAGDVEGGLGGAPGEVSTSIPVAVGWHESDYGTSFDQRTQLIDLFIQAVKANSTLRVASVDAVAGAAVVNFTPDQSVNHPKHFVTFDVAIEYEVN